MSKKQLAMFYRLAGNGEIDNRSVQATVTIHSILHRFSILGLITLAMVSFYTVNQYDYGVFRDAAEAVLDRQSPFSINDYYENETEEGTGYYNPPHTIVYLLPFLFWGERVLAFFNIIIIMLVLIGFERSLIATAGLGLILALSPQLIFIAAAVNIPGMTTGLGLLILLSGAKSVRRGLGWAILSGRPQDSVIALVYDFYRSFKNNRRLHWFAVGAAIVFALPSVILVVE